MGFKYDDRAYLGGSQVGHPTLDFGCGLGKPADISNVEEIYRLEFITSQARNAIENMKRQGREVPTRVMVRLTDAETRLDALLNDECPKLAFAMWLRARYEVEPSMKAHEMRQKMLELVGDIEIITQKAIDTGKLPNGVHVPSNIFVGAKLPNGSKVAHHHVSALDRAGFGNVWRWVHRLSPQEADKRIRKYVTEFYLEPEFSAMMKKFMSAIEMVKEAMSKTTKDKIVAFHNALTIAHSTTFVANNLYGLGSVEKLTKLSNRDHADWTTQVDQLVR